jgi:hypothetical protein
MVRLVNLLQFPKQILCKKVLGNNIWGHCKGVKEKKNFEVMHFLYNQFISIFLSNV